PLNNYTFEGVEDCGYMQCMRYYFTKTGNQVYGIALYADGTNAEKAAYENALIYMLKSFKLPDATNDIVSKEAAMTKVKSLPEVVDYLKRVPNGLVLINGEQANAYMVQVYEIKNGFTATFNWYKVDRTTGAIEKQF
ncbi:MAG: hypothetical protein Q7R51_00830, partial [bacterium]|nr:hypothetical protein [bacterium]